MTDRTPTDEDRALAARWLDVLVLQSGFPYPDRLARHLAGSTVTACCDCGCKSFSIATSSTVEPLLSPGAGGMVFEAGFYEIGSRNPLDLLLFVDAGGCASFLEVDYCVNAYPVPKGIIVEQIPYQSWTCSELTKLR